MDKLVWCYCMTLRQPIIATLGHVDHGKTSLLDAIRGTAIAQGEAGGITQAIGTTEIPAETIRKVAGPVLEKFRFSLDIPGLLFIDTPGHEAFSTLRKRGGSISDLAMLVVDINDGMMPQTEESLNILKNSRVPFVVVMTKIDKMEGWKPAKSFLENLSNQKEEAMGKFEESFYRIAEQFSAHGITVDRFDRVQDFTKTVAGIPVSAKTGEGLPELLAILSGLSQQFLKDRLTVTGRARGTVMEVKDVTGMGATIDTIIYDGSISKGEYLAIGGTSRVVTKIRTLMLPQPMRDIRTEKKFRYVNEVHAASGVKIAAPNLDNVKAGSPIASARTQEEAATLLESMDKAEDVEIRGEVEGIILRADTIGSLEAMINVFSKYPIKEALAGNVTRESIIKAGGNADPKFRVIASFNAKPSEEIAAFAKDQGITILVSDVIYRLEEEYGKWQKAKEEELKKAELEGVARPGKLRIIPGFVFRASNPAVAGCEILGGIIKPGFHLEKEGKPAGRIKQIENQGEAVQEAKIAEKVAVSIDGIQIGRGVKENDVLYTEISEADYRKLVKHMPFMSESEKAVLKEIEGIKRKERPAWGL